MSNPPDITPVKLYCVYGIVADLKEEKETWIREGEEKSLLIILEVEFAISICELEHRSLHFTQLIP